MKIMRSSTTASCMSFTSTGGGAGVTGCSQEELLAGGQGFHCSVPGTGPRGSPGSSVGTRALGTHSDLVGGAVVVKACVVVVDGEPSLDAAEAGEPIDAPKRMISIRIKIRLTAPP